MDPIIKEFWKHRSGFDGEAIARSLSLVPPADDPDRLRRFVNSTNSQTVDSEIRDRITYSRSGRCSRQEADGWVLVYSAFWKAAVEIVNVEEGHSKARSFFSKAILTLCTLTISQSSWTTTYEAWNNVVSIVSRGFATFGFERWALPVLEMCAKTLRDLALQADEERRDTQGQTNTTSFGDDFDLESEEHQKLEDCARQLNKLFNLCLNDRAELDKSRKWSIYYIINLLFKTYFRLNKASLSRNLIKALQAYRGDMPGLVEFKLSQVVTYQYYEGVLEFLEENYVKAEEHLTEAFYMCHKAGPKNKERILAYLIPCHLLTSHQLPSARLLSPYPTLQRLFLPISAAIKKGNLKAFDQALQGCEDELVQRRIYLTLERGRDIALRNLLRKVFIAGGFDEPKEPGDKPIRRTRVPVAEFQAAIALSSGESVDVDEVECLLANTIYKVRRKYLS